MGKLIRKPRKDIVKSVEHVPKAQNLTEDLRCDGINSVKLTKQQKRDLKRKQQLNNNNVISNGISRSNDIKENTSVYKRVSVFPSEYSTYKGLKDRFVRPTDKQYNDIVKTSYDGFVVSRPEEFNASFHDKFRVSLEGLETDNFYQFDLTQPTGLGTKVAKTFVSRCLVGVPGITYKYLGLRMFAHPWTEGELGATKSTIAIGKCNQNLIRHTEKLIRESGREETGSCQYNLTLVNRCYPDGCDKVILKEEPFFKKEKCTVSWHADSSLDHYSSIGVYHCTKNRSESSTTLTVSSDAVEKPTDHKLHNNKNFKKDKKGTTTSAVPIGDRLWEISLRLHFNAEGPNAGKPVQPYGDVANNSSTITPAIATPLPDQHSYFLLDDFNHHHQHSVLAGTTDRYASTHRVSRLEGHTFDYIRTKCQAALQQKCDLSVKSIRSEQLALTEVEFEWLRQFYIQGPLHYALHSWWHAPMQSLLELWERLELRTQIVIQALRDAALGVEETATTTTESTADAVENDNSNNSNNKNNSRKKLAKRIKYAECVTGVEIYNEMITFLSDRQFKRDGWLERSKDALYKKQPFDCQPMAVPFPVFELTQPYVTEVVAVVPTAVENDAVVAVTATKKTAHPVKDTKHTGDKEKKPKGNGVKSHPDAPVVPLYKHQELHAVVSCIETWREIFANKMNTADSTSD